MEVQVSMFWGEDAELETSTGAVFIPKNVFSVYTILGFRNAEGHRTPLLASMNVHWGHEPAGTSYILCKFMFHVRMILLKMQILWHLLPNIIQRPPCPHDKGQAFTRSSSSLHFQFYLLSHIPPPNPTPRSSSPVNHADCWLALFLLTIYWDVTKSVQRSLRFFLCTSLTFYMLPFVLVSQWIRCVYIYFH